MKYISYITLSTVLILSILSCKLEHKEGDGHDHGEETHQEGNGHDHEEAVHSGENGHEGHDEHEKGVLKLTNDQIKTVGLKFGNTSEIKVNDFISATGTLGIPPNGLTEVSPKASGILVSSKKFVEGEFIKKGATVGYIENPDFINSQEAYLKTKSEMVFTSAELSRQKALVAAEAGVEREVQKLESQHEAQAIRLKGLQKQLNYIGINTNNLTIDNITDRITIYSNGTGYISKIDLHNGMYVAPNKSLLEIISSEHLHLELDVFEKDINKIDKGQKISYSVPALGNDIYEGEVHVLAKEFNQANKTVRIHGHLVGQKPKFIKDLYVNAKIWLNDSVSNALPEGAVIRDEGSTYIYVGDPDAKENEVEFIKVMVVTGAKSNGYIGVNFVDAIPNGLSIVTEGAYYVYAQSKAGELEHEH